MWQDRSLLARESESASFAPSHAQEFAEALAARLGLDPDYVSPAFEDPLYHLQKERQLPVNVDPVDNRLDNPEDRERLRRVFERALETPAGHGASDSARVGKNGPEWQTGLWMLRGQHLYLLPGDSPLGLRAAVTQSPVGRAVGGAPIFHVDPMVNRTPPPIPPRNRAFEPPMIRTALQSRTRSERDRQPKAGESAAWIVRTALCVEARGGHLHVFMPPLQSADDYIDLLAAIEDVAGRLQMPVVIEGYTPPDGSRLQQIKITPDPGVIEVNIHPARNWTELAANTTALYEDARQVRLGTEKFMLDGRHTGTGGGNDFVLGGPARQSVPPPPGLVAEHDRVLAESSFAFLPLLNHLCRSDISGSARR